MRREADVSTLTCPITASERIALDDLRAATGATSDANLVRIALGKLALHYRESIAIAGNDFKCRLTRG